MPAALLIYNPASGRRRALARVPRLADAIARAGYTVRTEGTQHAGHAQDLAAEAAESGIETVFCHGGDGTVREAAKGLLGSSTSLAILPGGTANVLAQQWRIPRNALRAATECGSWRPRWMDAGLVRHGDGGEEPFLMMASCGLDGRVLRQPLGPAKARWGVLAVVGAGLAQWWRQGDETFTLEVEGDTYQSTFFALCNIPLYGGPFHLAPGARYDDGELDLVLYSGRGRRAMLGLAAAVVTRRHPRRSDVTLLRPKQVVVTSPKYPPLQLDGDAFDLAAPMTFSLHPHRLRILAPT